LKIISWNIQACRGVDNIVSIDRIADVIKQMGDADVICLQEVCVHYAAMDDNAGLDQAAELAARFPGHELFFSPAVDHRSDNGRALFGNMLLSRLPVLQCLRHSLPQPADPDNPSMPRTAIEVIVDSGNDKVRVLTTHLEYFSRLQCKAQCRALYTILDDASQRAQHPLRQTGKILLANVPQTGLGVACGDFNLEPSSEEYRLLTASDDKPLLFDAWAEVSDQPHLPTCGIHDHKQWPQGAHCRDFFFVTEPLKPRVKSVTVDVDTDASDHQPIKLILN